MGNENQIPKQSSKMPKWANVPSVTQLKEDYALARETHTKVSEKVTRHLDNLHITGSAKIANKNKNRSSVQPKLIRKNAEWRYAALSEPFLSSDNIFSVYPVTWEDGESAEENQLVLNHQFNNQLNKVKFIDEYVRTCVNEGTVIVRVSWNYKEVPKTEELIDMSKVLSSINPYIASRLIEISNILNPKG